MIFKIFNNYCFKTVVTGIIKFKICTYIISIFYFSVIHSVYMYIYKKNLKNNLLKCYKINIKLQYMQDTENKVASHKLITGHVLDSADIDKCLKQECNNIFFFKKIN